MWFVGFSKQILIISIHNIKISLFTIEMHCVVSEIKSEVLYVSLVIIHLQAVNCNYKYR